MDRIEHCISFQIGKAAQQVSKRAKELLAPYGVTPVQYAALKCLSEVEGMSGAELGARIVLDSASITGVVDRLDAIDLVRRRPDPHDRRVHRLHLTKKSLSLLAALDQAMDELNEHAARILGNSSDETSRNLLKLGNNNNWSNDV